ncbi:MAG: GNAT family N-acetyltransferase [Bryobacteraceae bacterium]
MLATSEVLDRRNVQIRSIGRAERDPLITMYDRFEPLGGSLGLPSYKAEVRRAWIDHSLRHTVNVAAFSPAGEVVGHCMLAADEPGSAEMAIFVHQQSRRRGIGRTLLRAALERAAAAGLGRVWSLTSPDNRAALRLQESCGFRLTKSMPLEAEMEIDLPGSEELRRYN